ncbi:hypothetical protein [Sinomonas cyclohexanicum]|nr:hypothetical protein [Corynebacterium cyclohexanicum]
MDLPILMTPEQAAEQLNKAAAGLGGEPVITGARLRQAIREGSLAHVVLARGKWMLTEEHVREWITSAQTRPATGGAARRERQPMGATSRSRNTTRNH